MSTPPSLDSLPGTSEFTQMPLQRLKRRGPLKNFGVYTGIIGIGIASYLLVLILIVVPGVCESTSIHEKTHSANAVNNVLRLCGYFVGVVEYGV